MVNFERNPARCEEMIAQDSNLFLDISKQNVTLRCRPSDCPTTWLRADLCRSASRDSRSAAQYHPPAVCSGIGNRVPVRTVAGAIKALVFLLFPLTG